MKAHLDTVEELAMTRLAQRCARQVSFTWLLAEDQLTFGADAEEFLAPGLLTDVASGADFIARIDPDDRGPLMDAITRTVKAGETEPVGVYEALVRLHSAPQTWHWIAMRGNVTAVGVDGRATRISGVLVDETTRETERREAVRMRDLYAMLSASNRAVAASADKQTLLSQLCRIAVEHGRFGLSWVAIGDHATGLVSPYAQGGTPTDYPQRVIVATQAGHLLGTGLTAAAIRHGQVAIHNDLSALSEPPDWAVFALANGFRSIGCFPLFERGTAIGALLLYSHEARHFDTGMAALVESLCSDVSHALDTLLIKQGQAEADRQLAEANKHFQTAMATSLDGMLIAEPDGRILEMNPAACQLLNCDSDRVRGLNLFDSFTPARYRAARKTQIRRLLQPNAPRDQTHRRIETFVSRCGGAEVPVELVVTPLDVGAQARVMLMLRDLTAMLRQREMLIESSRRFENMVEQSPDAVVVHVRGRIVLCNERLRQLVGAADDADPVGSDFRDMFHPSSHATYDQRLHQVAHGDADGAAAMREGLLLHADGHSIEVDVIGTDTDHHGEPARQVVIRDITARKREERRRRSQHVVLGMIAARTPLTEVLLQICRELEQTEAGVKCAIYLADDNGRAFTAQISPSMSDAPLAQDDLRDPRPATGSILARVIETGQRLIVADVAALTGTPSVLAWRRTNCCRAAAAWPVFNIGGQLMGVVYIALPEPGEPPQHLLDTTTEFLDLTAVAIDNDHQASRVRHLAQHDALTGLPNRAMFKELLDAATERAARRESKLATLFIDLDRFKQINDTFGHDTGDMVLCEVARRLRGTVREGDHAARMGGDEFYVLADDLDRAESAAVIAQRVLEALAEPIVIDGNEHELSASIGIAVYPRDGLASDDLLKHADIAMYRAKNAGRASYSFFAEADNTNSTQRFALQAQLRRALQRRQFFLHYQPKVCLRTGRITGVEALVRWQHPERGLVMPGEFIGVAEETGLITVLGQQIMAMAFAAAPRLAAASGGPNFTTAINLSALQFGTEGFVDEVRELVTTTGIDPRNIEFEITESVLMRRPEQARAAIEQLQAMGFEFSIDDFGTGYSSLTYLKRFPVQCVKIDRSFVKDIPGDASDLAITRAIVAMAHSLGLMAVAEGVETLEQLDALRQMDCDQFQGYYFSKPVALDLLLAMLETSVAA